MKFINLFVPVLLFVGFVGLAQGTDAINEDRAGKPFMIPAVKAK